MKQEGDKPDLSDESLDDLLASASWPKIEPDPEARLRETWHTSFHYRHAPWLRIAAAISSAAAVVAVAWGVWHLAPQRHESITVAGMPAEDVRPVAVQTDREPSAFERLTGMTPKPPRARNIATSDRTDDSPQNDVGRLLASGQRRDVEQFLALVAQPQTRDEALATLRASQRPPIEMLLDQLGNGRVDRRLAAAIALGNVCHEDLVRRLILMVERDDCRREALAALVRCHRPEAANYIRMARQNPRVDAQLRSVEVQMRHVLS